VAKRNFTPPRTGNPKRNAAFSERETAYEITDAVLRAGDRLVIPGQCDREIGTEAHPANDTSEPGVVIRIEENRQIDSKPSEAIWFRRAFCAFISTW